MGFKYHIKIFERRKKISMLSTSFNMFKSSIDFFYKNRKKYGMHD